MALEISIKDQMIEKYQKQLIESKDQFYELEV